MPANPAPGRSPGTARRRRDRILLGLAVLCLLAYLPALLSVLLGGWPFEKDAPALVGVWREFARASLWRGILPLWNPYLFCGLPFLSNGQTSVLYPPNLLYWFVPLRPALLLDAYLHNVLLAWGMYALGRSLRMSRSAAFVAAATLGLGAAVSSHLYAGHLTWHAARAYLPWQLWALLGFLRTGSKRWLAILGGAFVLQCYCGYPPYVLLSGGLCCGLIVAWTVHRFSLGERLAWEPRAGWHLAGAGALCLAIMAVQVLPLIEVARWSVHGSSLPYAEAVRLSGTWKTLVRLVMPDFFGGNGQLQWSFPVSPQEEPASIGLLPLILALLAPLLIASARPGQQERRDGSPAVGWLWALMLASLVLAMGDRTPLYRPLFQHFALLRLARVPVRWMEVWALCAALLAAFAFDAVVHRARQKPTPAAAWPQWALVALALVLGGLGCWVATTSPTAPLWTVTAQWNQSVALTSKFGAAIAAQLRATALFESILTALMAGLLALIYALWRNAAPARRRGRERLLVGAIVLNLLLQFWRGARPLGAREFESNFAWPRAIARRYRTGRRWNTSLVNVPSVNRAALEGIDLFNGYDALNSRRYFDFVNFAERRQFWDAVYQPQTHRPLLRVAGVTDTLSWLLDPPDLHARDTTLGPLEARDGKWTLWENRGAWPRVYLSRRVLRVPADRQLMVLAALARRDFDSRRAPAVTGAAGFAGLGSQPFTKGDAIMNWQSDLNSFTVAARATAPSVLVIGEADCPGWKAWVNGAPAAVVPANYLFRAVEVPSGASSTVMVYDSETLRFALFVSLCGLGSAMLALVAAGRRGSCKAGREGRQPGA